MKAFVPLAALVLAGLTACATSVEVDFDERHDFTPYRTWAWLPGEATHIDAPLGDPTALEAKLTRQVDRAMSARGLVRSAEKADLLVSAYLGVQRLHVYVNETGAIESVQSLHASPSYEVQTTTQQIHSYERGYVVIAVSDASQGRLVWRGVYRSRVRGAFWPHLDTAVSTLLEGFPPEREALSPPGS